MPSSKKVFVKIANTALMVFVSLHLFGCGSGGGSSNSTSTPTPPPPATPATYSVGGTISGLTVNGLALTDGTDTATLSANATAFSFPTQLATGASYAISVSQQPLGFTVLCAVGAGASGTVTTTVSVLVTCNPAQVRVTTLAGSTTAGSVDGTGTAASFNNPHGVAVDSANNVYVADSNNNTIRKITPAGVVTTLAGSTTAGNTDGTGTAARFSAPVGVALDSAGNVYVADSMNNTIRKITSTGVVMTLAGNPTAGNTDGTGTAASFNDPEDVAVDSAGNVYVADSGNNSIRKVTPSGVVTTIAGNPTAGSTDGTGAAARFNSPIGIAVDSAGTVYVADFLNHEIRKITPAGVVTTLAGNTTPGSADGTGAAASFFKPDSVAVDAVGNVYVADHDNNEIRKVTAAGVVSTLAGSSTVGSSDGVGVAASFDHPAGVAVDSVGNVYVGDSFNNSIRKLTAF